MKLHNIFFFPLLVLLMSAPRLQAGDRARLPTIGEVLLRPSYATASDSGRHKESSGTERAKLDRRLRSAKAKHLLASERIEKGLRARNLNTSRRHFEVALAHDAQALRVLDRLLQGTAEGDLARELTSLVRSVKEQRLSAQLHIAKLYRQRARELVQRALRSTRQLGVSRRHLQAALAHQSKSLSLLDRLNAQVSGEASKRSRELVFEVTDETIQTHLHIAHLYTSRESYQKAIGWVNAALALDPGHPRALADRGRIELAISNG